MKYRFNQYLVLTSIVAVFAISSCDQKSNYYKDYNSGQLDGLTEKGWIPNELCFESMQEIHLTTNMDLNTCVFDFTLNQQHFDAFLKKVEMTNSAPILPRRISQPKWWSDISESHKTYIFIEPEVDTVFISFNNKTRKVYGWRNNKTLANNR